MRADNPSPPVQRSRREWVLLVLIPIIGNALFAAFLFARVPATTGPGGAEPTLATPPTIVNNLPRSELIAILASVERSTGHHYTCEGPWRSSDGWSNWSCRTSEALVVLQGADAQRITQMNATWFGFDAASTDLPAWAAAVQRLPALAEASESWVATELGDVASTEILKVRLDVGGARGALNLRAASAAAGS